MTTIVIGGNCQGEQAIERAEGETISKGQQGTGTINIKAQRLQVHTQHIQRARNAVSLQHMWKAKDKDKIAKLGCGHRVADPEYQRKKSELDSPGFEEAWKVFEQENNVL